jgi:signal transduction histidine kinase
MILPFRLSLLRLARFGLLCMLVSALARTSAAQAPNTAIPGPITSIGALCAMTPDQAEDQPRGVRVRGVVIFVSSEHDAFKIHDGEHGIGVSLPDGTPCPKVGDTVEVEGHTKAINVETHRYPHVEGERVAVTGAAAFPKPLPVTVTELAAFTHYNQWVSVEGIVVMWTLKSPTLSIMITGPETWAVVHVRGFRPADFPKNLHGARIRVSGVNMGVTHSQTDTLIAPSPAQLEVLTPGTADIFEAPLTPMEEVAQQRIPTAERVRIRGVVTATTGRQIVCLRDGASAVCVGLEHGWLRSSSRGHLYADGGPLPELTPGDQVEVVGSRWDPSQDGRENGFSLHVSHIRIVGSQPPPQPLKATLSEIAGGALTHHLVQVRGRLVHQDQFPLNRSQWRTTLLVESGGVKLPATLQSRTKNPFPHFKLNDDLQITGLVDPATASAERQLWLVSPGDVMSLGLSPVVRQRQLWLWAGMAVGIAAIAGFWIFTLSRAVRQHAQAEIKIQELNQGLEQRVTERTLQLQRAKAELDRALAQERELGELKSRFVTMVSHEFRTPLGIIMSAVELMRHYDDRLPAEQKHELQEDIHSATKLMASLMEQILVLGRVEAGKLGCRPVQLDLNGLAEKLTDESLSATNHKCPIIWKPQGDLSGACADEGLLRHIFTNLIANAVKYSPEGSEVVFRAHREGPDAVFQIEDHGIGIPGSDLPQLFEAFYRCSNVGEIPGTGLGLVIVKRCVELHEGTMNLDSTVGSGTTFTVRLPLFSHAVAAAPA